jgi:hypothetical protein
MIYKLALIASKAKNKRFAPCTIHMAGGKRGGGNHPDNTLEPYLGR